MYVAASVECTADEDQKIWWALNKAGNWNFSRENPSTLCIYGRRKNQDQVDTIKSVLANYAHALTVELNDL